MSRKVVVAMSGGVDSSVAAALLREQGYDVTGVYIEAVNTPGCRADQDRKDALEVAMRLGIRFQTIDFRKEYKRKVVQYFLDEYEAGRTPNPDVVCNREIKFGLFLDWALRQAQGKPRFEKVATGHYARIVQRQGSELNRQSSEPCLLRRARDESKDQSYFLWQVPPERLKQVLFPLGEMTKSEVRKRAKQLGLPNADKPDSMGVCMMGELNVREWLRDRLGEREGEVVIQCTPSTNAKCTPIVVGRHRGLWFSTIGQRVGSEISLQGRTLKAVGVDTTKMPVLYVVGKEMKNNRLVVGEREACYRKQFSIYNFQFTVNDSIINELIGEHKLFVRVRNLGEMHRIVRMYEFTNARMEIETEEDMWGVAEGQSGVFYDSEGIVVGGGVIV